MAYFLQIMQFDNGRLELYSVRTTAPTGGHETVDAHLGIKYRASLPSYHRISGSEVPIYITLTHTRCEGHLH